MRKSCLRGRSVLGDLCVCVCVCVCVESVFMQGSSSMMIFMLFFVWFYFRWSWDGFGGPGGGFRTGRSSGKATAGTGAKKTTPRTTQSTTGTI